MTLRKVPMTLWKTVFLFIAIWALQMPTPGFSSDKTDCSLDKPDCPCDKPKFDKSFDFFGFIKGEGFITDRINEFSSGDQPDIFPVGVPYNSQKEFHHSESIWDARNTHFGFEVKDKVYDIEMKGIVYMDFATDDGNALISNSRRPRLYHAFARADLPSGLFIIAGQWWSIAFNRDIQIPDYVSSQPIVGQVYSRQPQFCLGYKHHICPADGYIQAEIDVEKHSFNDVVAPLATNIQTSEGCEQRYPLFAVKVSWLQKIFNAQIVFAGTESMSVVNPITGRETETGVWLMEALTTFRWRNFLFVFSAHHSDGLSRIFFENFPDIVIGANGSLHPVQTNGGFAGFRWDWIKEVLWLDCIYGIDHAIEIPGTTLEGSAHKAYRQFRANIYYNFWKHWQFGCEYDQVNVKGFDGQKGQQSAIHFCLNYYFGENGEILRRL